MVPIVIILPTELGPAVEIKALQIVVQNLYLKDLIKRKRIHIALHYHFPNMMVIVSIQVEIIVHRNCVNKF